MAINVKFLSGLSTKFETIAKESTTFYMLTDTNDLYFGEQKITNAKDLATAIGRISNNESEIATVKEQLRTLVGESSGSIQSMIDSSVSIAKKELEAKIKTNTDSIAAINHVDTGILKQAKDYADGKDAAIAEAKNSGDTAQADVNDLIPRVTKLEGDVGVMDNLDTTAKTDLVSAVNEVKAALASGGTDAVVTIETTATSEGAAKSYTVKQGTRTVGTIDIPKDMVVESGSVEKNPAGQPEGTYIKLVLANVENPLFVNVGTLVDIYTAKGNATQVQLTIDSNSREISATIVPGSIGVAELATNSVTTVKIADANVTLAKLAADVKASLGKADTAVQSVEESTVNGSVTVDGADVPIHGLGTAAFTGADAYDIKGSATNAENKAKMYADGLAKNYDPAGSAKAVETALINALTWHEF